MASKLVRWPKIMLYGDSITQFSMSAEGCWGALLADHFQRRADVVVRGFSGYNTRNCLALLPHVATELEGFVGATVFLGANDASLPNSPQAVPLDEYARNLKGIVKHFESAGLKTLVITPPALDSTAWSKVCQVTSRVHAKDEALTAAYAQACKEAAEEVKAPVLDLHTAMINQADWRGFLCDGLHLSRKGSEFLASLLIPAVEKHLTSRCLPTNQQLLPPWSDLDPNNSATSFKNWCNNEEN